MDKYGMIKFSVITIVVLILFFSPSTNVSFAQEINDVPKLFKKANEHFMQGEYHQAIEIFDEILEISPTSKKTLLMKGIALSNLERHKSSILEILIANQMQMIVE